MCCCMVRTAVHTYCCVCTYSGERGAWRGVERQKTPCRPRSGIVRCTTVIVGGFFFCPLYPPPSLVYFRVFSAVLPWHCRSAGLLLSYTHRGFVGCCWIFFVLLCAVLYYRCTTYCCCTAVVRGGWVDRFVGVSMGSWVFFHFVICFPRYTDPALV